MSNTLKSTAKAGFTLVELAIVLVIIGLIVGGVLVGQDLIKAAEIRSTMSDIESYNSAATTFRNKYNGLPGDLLASRASQFGLTSRAGSAGQGDGNSVVEGGDAGQTNLESETALFWRDLTDAELIPDAYSTATDAAVAATADIPDTVPNTPIRETAYVHVFPRAGRNYFYVGNFTVSTGAITVAATAGLTPNEASQIDEKADDGLPTTGIVRSVTGFGTDYVSVDAGDTAVNEPCAANDVVTGEILYNAANEDYASSLLCNLYYRASF